MLVDSSSATDIHFVFLWLSGYGIVPLYTVFCFVLFFSHIQFSSVTQSCLTLCDLMNHRTPGLPVHHQLWGFTQTHVHWVSDAIQPSHPLSFPSPPALNLSQHHDLFKWVSSMHPVANVLEFQLHHQSFQWTPRTDLLRMDGLDLPAIQGTLKSLLQHHNLKASILQRIAFWWSNSHIRTW